MLNKFLYDQSGATAIEYGLIAALISISVVAGYKALSSGLVTHWDGVADAVTGAGADYINE